MNISFNGTLAEFRALFGHVMAVDAYDPGPQTVSIVSSQPDTPLLVRDNMAIGPTEEKPVGQAMRADLPLPDTLLPESVQETLARLPEVSPTARRDAWTAFKKVCFQWSQNFGVEEAVQPDRLSLLQSLGSGRHTIPVLVMAYEMLSLQRLVEKALVESDVTLPEGEARLDYVDQIAANMAQVSHFGFAELAGTYDYSLRWRRAA